MEHVVTDPLTGKRIIETLEINDLTVGVDSTDPVLGTGYFDKLMIAAKEHLTREYTEQRITGDTYAQAYIAMMQGVLQTASNFLVASYNANEQHELTKEELARIRAQTENIQQQTLNLTAEYSNITKQGQLIDAQTITQEAQATNINEDTKVKTEQIDHMREQVALMIQQTLTETEQTKLVAANTAVATSQKTLVDNQASTEEEQAKLVTANAALATSNKELTDQRKATEEANVKDTVNGSAVAGVLGRKNALADEQVKAFKVDKVAKAVKSITDGFAVVQTSDVAPDAVPEAYSKPYLDPEVKGLIDLAKQ